jgi:hypothetical protein
LPKKNKSHASPFLTGIPNFAKERATVRFPWNRTDATPTFTGLPPHVCILAQLEGLKESLAQVMDNIINGVKNDLDWGRKAILIKKKLFRR